MVGTNNQSNARPMPGGGGLGMGWLGINKAIKLKVILSPDIRLRKFSLNLQKTNKVLTKMIESNLLHKLHLSEPNLSISKNCQDVSFPCSWHPYCLMHFCYLHSAVGQNQAIIIGFAMILEIFWPSLNHEKMRTLYCPSIILSANWYPILLSSWLFPLILVLRWRRRFTHAMHDYQT